MCCKYGSKGTFIKYPYWNRRRVDAGNHCLLPKHQTNNRDPGGLDQLEGSQDLGRGLPVPEMAYPIMVLIWVLRGLHIDWRRFSMILATNDTLRYLGIYVLAKSTRIYSEMHTIGIYTLLPLRDLLEVKVTPKFLLIS